MPPSLRRSCALIELLVPGPTAPRRNRRLVVGIFQHRKHKGQSRHPNGHGRSETVAAKLTDFPLPLDGAVRWSANEGDGDSAQVIRPRTFTAYNRPARQCPTSRSSAPSGATKAKERSSTC